MSPATARFFESPEGLDFLHRLVVAMLFVMTLRSPDGVRVVCEFLELAGLADFVAPSLGTVHGLARRMQREIHAFDREQRSTLGSDMESKKVTICEDETFHPAICLVAIEPVSGFIVLEKYADKRDAETWTMAMKEALAGLPVEVIQTTTDEAKALKAHAEEAFKAHHSPDVFHGQYTVSRAISRPLGLLVEHAKARFEAAVLAAEQAKEDRATYERTPHGPGRPPDFAGRIAAAEAAATEARSTFEEAEVDREAARAAVRGISAAYHPYCLADGSSMSAEAVKEELHGQFDALDAIADKTKLPERCGAGIDKARRLVGSMVATIQFVHDETASRLAALEVSEEVREVVRERLLPARYLERAATRASKAEERHRLLATAAALASSLQGVDSVLAALPSETRAAIEMTAAECADLFQRSSSCVEGRNGQLSLFHHGQHNLTKDKLEALTAVHNYFIRREDGTTAAERFFGRPPPDLFEHLVSRLPRPPRPATRRRPRTRAIPYRLQRAMNRDARI